MNILFIFLLALFLPITTMFSTENQTDLSETVESALVDKEEQPDQNTINQLQEEVLVPPSICNKKGFKKNVTEFIKKYPADIALLSLFAAEIATLAGFSKFRNVGKRYPAITITFLTAALCSSLQFLNKIYSDKNTKKLRSLITNKTLLTDFLEKNEINNPINAIFKKINRSKKIDLSLKGLEVFLTIILFFLAGSAYKEHRITEDLFNMNDDERVRIKNILGDTISIHRPEV